MARRPRIESAGFHHIVNRGVNRANIFNNNSDKDKFLEILCKASKDYKVNIHTYCLMDNHYHLLVETTTNNLSLYMRQINSNYAIYFNKKYNRVGHLWQGRFKSWYVIDEKYLYQLIKYIEHNPIEAKITNTIAEYPYTLLHTILNKNKKIIPCAQHSKLKKDILYLKEYLSVKLTDTELNEIKEKQKAKITQIEYKYSYHKLKDLKEYFKNIETLEDRNKSIIKAISDGHKQIDIAKFLNITPTAISKIKKKYEKD